MPATVLAASGRLRSASGRPTPWPAARATRTATSLAIAMWTRALRHFGDGGDGPRDLAFERAAVVHLLEELGRAERGAVEDLEADAARRRQALRRSSRRSSSTVRFGTAMSRPPSSSWYWTFSVFRRVTDAGRRLPAPCRRTAARSRARSASRPSRRRARRRRRRRAPSVVELPRASARRSACGRGATRSCMGRRGSGQSVTRERGA